MKDSQAKKLEAAKRAQENREATRNLQRMEPLDLPVMEVYEPAKLGELAELPTVMPDKRTAAGAAASATREGDALNAQNQGTTELSEYIRRGDSPASDRIDTSRIGSARQKAELEYLVNRVSRAADDRMFALTGGATVGPEEGFFRTNPLGEAIATSLGDPAAVLLSPFRSDGEYVNPINGYSLTPSQVFDAKFGLLTGALGTATTGLGVASVRSSLSRVSFADDVAPFSRLVDGGGLQAHENAGGHLLLKHVGQDESALLSRLTNEPKISGSSSFYDRATAENAVSNLVDANQPKISNWLEGTGGRLRLDGTQASPVGITVTRGAPSAIDVNSLRVILVRDPNMSTGYKILTSFPTKP